MQQNQIVEKERIILADWWRSETWKLKYSLRTKYLHFAAAQVCYVTFEDTNKFRSDAYEMHIQNSNECK